jgi:hypothetical protein
MSRRKRPFDPIPYTLPSLGNADLIAMFPATDASASAYSARFRVTVPCAHWLQVLRQADLTSTASFFAIGGLDYSAVRSACDHSVGTVLRAVLENLRWWPAGRMKVASVMARCLAAVMAAKVDRGHALWDAVADWLLKCIDETENGEWEWLHDANVHLSIT